MAIAAAVDIPIRSNAAVVSQVVSNQSGQSGLVSALKNGWAGRHRVGIRQSP